MDEYRRFQKSPSSKNKSCALFLISDVFYYSEYNALYCLKKTKYYYSNLISTQLLWNSIKNKWDKEYWQSFKRWANFGYYWRKAIAFCIKTFPINGYNYSLWVCRAKILWSWLILVLFINILYVLIFVENEIVMCIIWSRYHWSDLAYVWKGSLCLIIFS